MTKTLMLITGAGASHDVANPLQDSVKEEYTPPLTNKLFLSGKGQLILYVRECLQKNPYAAQIGRDWKQGKQSLESYLAGLKDSRYLMLRKQYWAIPIYLHELFLRISLLYINSDKPGIPSNYKSLIDAIARNGSYGQIIWLNLNYDTFADMAIKESTGNGLNDFGDYMGLVTPDKIKIMYTKPHGSIDWYRRNSMDIPWGEIKACHIPDDFENRLSKTIVTEHLARDAKLTRKEVHLYPAISAPLGKYEYAYPDHIKAMMHELEKNDAVSLLCIGFSALDEDILDLIKANSSRINKIKMVNGDANWSKEAYVRLGRYCGSLRVAKEGAISNVGFTGFINDGLDEWLQQ